ncbi:MAG: DUF262 domain-containing protein [Synechococcus sp. SB0665_bin_28]|nr:DUF262 domain-containing protein [Synechococcus sp. SB0665_bin_28]
MTQAEPVTALPGSGAEAGQSRNLESEPLGDDPAEQLANGNEDVEGLGSEPGSWGNYPLDELLIRNEVRTIYEVIRRIGQKDRYIMNPDFQRDFIWSPEKQSKLIKSVIMRIPLPVFYLAEDSQGRMIVVDGLQRLSTFQRFLNNQLKLKLPYQNSLNGNHFVDLPIKLQNRIEDCNLIFYLIDAKVPEATRLDIFERVNDSVPLTRQQMRNCLYMGKGTRFLKEESKSQIFLEATGKRLNSKIMRDREFVNRFCAFQLLDRDSYRADMDKFLTDCLKKMNGMEETELSELSEQLRKSLENNFILFGKHAFRKHKANQDKRRPVNASLWDVMSTGLSYYATDHVQAHAEPLCQAIDRILADQDFDAAITLGTNSVKKVMLRFEKAQQTIEEVLGAHTA